MMVNGEPSLTCKTFVREFPSHIRIEPLANFPIERDLITDQEGFMKKLSSVKPYMIPKEERSIEQGEYIQFPRQLKAFKQYSMCINCALCYSACPQVALNPDFIGPAALALAHRYNADSRDGGRKERADVIAANEGVWECSFVGACSKVCPKDVDPAGAIQQEKLACTVDYFKFYLMPWSR